MIMPIGIIEQSTEDGAIFKLTRPEDHSALKINSSGSRTLRSASAPEIAPDRISGPNPAFS